MIVAQLSSCRMLRVHAGLLAATPLITLHHDGWLPSFHHALPWHGAALLWSASLIQTFGTCRLVAQVHNAVCCKWLSQ